MYWLSILKRATLLIVFLTTGSLLLLTNIMYKWRQYDSPSDDYSGILKNQITEVTRPLFPDIDVMTDEIKHILLWDVFFDQPDYGVGYGTDTFDKTNCSKRCYITDDMSLMDVSHAVVVHAFNTEKRNPGRVLPRRKNRNQIFVFFLLESQLRSYPGFFTNQAYFRNTFNLTFTFLNQPDTDIYTPIGYAEKLTESHADMLPQLVMMKEKPKLVFWVISNCKAPSSRTAYAEQLSKLIAVDIYGSCGNKTYTSHNVRWTELQERYMFYLAFENSYCQDYITEKAFRTLTWTKHVVPVVLGGGNYTRDLPPHSFIDVRDFDSPQSLAEYMLYLKGNLTAYMEYFQWKEFYRIHLERDSRRNGFCRLCEILHTESFPYKTQFDAVKYWSPAKQCLTANMCVPNQHSLREAAAPPNTGRFTRLFNEGLLRKGRQ